MSEELMPQAPEASIRDYLDLIRRRRAVILQTFLTVVVVGLVITLLSKPVYRSQVQMVVEGRNTTVRTVDANNPISPLLSNDTSHDIQTQVAIMNSSAVIIRAFKLAQVPGGTAKLAAKQEVGTDIITVQVDSTKADYATRLAKVMPDAYESYMNSNLKDEVTKSLEFATGQLATAQSALAGQEQQVREFKARARLIGSKEEQDQLIKSVADSDAKIEQTKAEITSLRSRKSRLESDLKNEPKYVDQTSSQSNPNKAIFQDKIDQLNVEREGLLVLYTKDSVQVQAIDSKIAELKRKLDAAPEMLPQKTHLRNPKLDDIIKQVDTTNVELAGREAMLRDLMLARPNIDYRTQAELMQREAELTRQVDQSKMLTGAYQKTVQELELKRAAEHHTVKKLGEVSGATQIAPRLVTNMVVAVFVGVVLGLCFALLQEFLDDRIKSAEDVRAFLTAPVLSYVPLVESGRTSLVVRGERGSSLLESYRVMRANVQFATVDESTKSIVVSSASPGEGKSVTASNLAVVMALDGKRVVLVDADLRRPTIHAKFNVEQRPGLSNVLVGHTPLVDALQETDTPGLYVLTSGPLPPNPAELLNSRAMRKVHDELREIADVVIFDTPPYLATADAQVLSAQADGIIYVIQFGEARKSAVRHAVDLIHQAHAKVIGVVFNKIDLSSRRDDYYYGYYRYYNYYHVADPSEGNGTSGRRVSTKEFDALLAAANAKRNGGHAEAAQGEPEAGDQTETEA